MSALCYYLLNVWLVTVNSKLNPSLFGNDSGSFGNWSQNNPYNLPSYIYTMNQLTDPTATIYNTSVEYQTWDHYLPSRNNITDHKFQFGNDRITIVASNYGYIQARSDESGPKLLNDFNRNSSQFGAGIAYLTNNNNNILASTFFTGDSMDHREYSFFYRIYTTNSTKSPVLLNQTLITPFGDDPVVISQITLQANQNMDNLNYYEVYGGSMYQLLDKSPDTIRSYQVNNYNVTYSASNINKTNGILASYKYKGAKQNIPGVKNGWYWDENPPQMFVSTIGKTVQNMKISFGCDMNAFFGNSGVENPTFSLSKCAGAGDIKSAGIVVKVGNISLTKGVKYTFYIISGYIPNGFTLNKLIAKYNDDTVLANLLENSAKLWYNDAIKFNTANYPEITREVLWDYGYTRSALSYYDLYGEYILDQGTWYRYVNGFQGAFRDPLQHMLPLIFTDPDKVKSIIRYSLKQIQPKFSDVTRYFNVPYALMANGIIFDGTVSAAPSDLEIYLLWSVSEYILATKDTAFLDEIIYLNVYDNDDSDYMNKTVLDCLLEAYEFLHSHIGVGRHGVIRVQTGDWSDSYLQLSGANMTLVYEEGLFYFQHLGRLQ